MSFTLLCVRGTCGTILKERLTQLCKLSMFTLRALCLDEDITRNMFGFLSKYGSPVFKNSTEKLEKLSL